MLQRIKRHLQQVSALTLTVLLLSQSGFTAFAQDATQETTDDTTTQETQSEDNSGSQENGDEDGDAEDREDESEDDEDTLEEEDKDDNSGSGRNLPPRTLEDRMEKDRMQIMETRMKDEDGEMRRPHIREGLAEKRRDIYRRAGFVLVQWGYIANPFEDKEPFEWNGSITVSEGAQVKLMREVLFEDNDSVSQESEDMPVNIAAVTTVHWDGLLVRVKPQRPESDESEDSDGTREGESYDPNTVITVVLNGITLEVSLRELFENGKIVEDLADGRQVVIRNIGGPRHLSDDVRERVFAAKDKALHAQERVEEFIKKLLEEGRITQEQYARLQKVFARLFGATLTDGLLARLQAKFSGLRERLDDGDLSVDILTEEVSALADNLESSGQQERFEAGIIPFCDTGENEWFTQYVQFLKDSDIVSGDAGKCTFRPGDFVSRAELLKMAIEAAGDAGLLPSDSEASSGQEAAPQDSRGHWAKRYIAFGLKKGSVSGFSDGFRPNQPVTRAEAVKIILNILGTLPDREELAATFPDTQGHWGATLIAYAQELGIVSGDGDTGNFRPNAPLNRAEAAKIITAAIDAIASDVTLEESEPL